jgi:hypothetical protein
VKKEKKRKIGKWVKYIWDKGIRNSVLKQYNYYRESTVKEKIRVTVKNK